MWRGPNDNRPHCLQLTEGLADVSQLVRPAMKPRAHYAKLCFFFFSELEPRWACVLEYVLQPSVATWAPTASSMPISVYSKLARVEARALALAPVPPPQSALRLSRSLSRHYTPYFTQRERGRAVWGRAPRARGGARRERKTRDETNPKVSGRLADARTHRTWHKVETHLKRTPAPMYTPTRAAQLKPFQPFFLATSLRLCQSLQLYDEAQGFLAGCVATAAVQRCLGVPRGAGRAPEEAGAGRAVLAHADAEARVEVVLPAGHSSRSHKDLARRFRCTGQEAHSRHGPPLVGEAARARSTA